MMYIVKWKFISRKSQTHIATIGHAGFYTRCGRLIPSEHDCADWLARPYGTEFVEVGCSKCDKAIMRLYRQAIKQH